MATSAGVSLREIYLGEEWLHKGDGYIRYVTMVIGIRFVAMVMYVTMVMPYNTY